MHVTKDREVLPLKEYKRTFIIYPYFFALTILGMIMLGGIAEGILIKLTVGSTDRESWICFTGLTALNIFCIAVWLSIYEATGWFHIRDDCLEFHALFHLKRVMRYDEIKYLGIDYDPSLDGLFWIYFSKEKLDMKYYHKILKLRSSRRTVVIQYSEEVFRSLVHYLPKPLSKRLEANYSVIRLHRAEM